MRTSLYTFDMPHAHYDLIVIGTGPAGEGAAMKAAKAGKRVAAIERYHQIGGGATHWETIPSKALRAAIQHVNLLHQNPMFPHMEVPVVGFPELLARAKTVVDSQAQVHASFFHRNNVIVHTGHAR